MSTRIEFPLDRGERQLWEGVPAQGPILRSNDLLMVPFSLVWAGIAFTVFSVGPRGAGPPLPFALLFGIAAIYITVGRFAVDAWRRSRITYAVTSERIIIQSGVFSPSVKSLNLRTISDLSLTERRDGTGTITFGPTPFNTAMFAGTPWPGVTMPPSFEAIKDAKQVYGIIRDAQRATQGG
jgi:hypothetical protein